MTGTRISEQKAFSQRRRLSRVSRRMSWSFPGEYREKWGTMGNNEQTDRKIERERERERETECLYNMLNSPFSLIKEKEKVNMTSSESIGSPSYAAIRLFIMNKIQPATRAPFISFFNSTTTLWYHLLSTSHLIIPANQFLI